MIVSINFTDFLNTFDFNSFQACSIFETFTLPSTSFKLLAVALIRNDCTAYGYGEVAIYLRSIYFSISYKVWVPKAKPKVIIQRNLAGLPIQSLYADVVN